MKWPWQQEKPPEEVAELEQSLRETRLLIAQAYAGFNSAADPELVESYVYEIQALQARYSYLLRRRKAQEGTGEEPARTEEGSPVPILPVA